MAQKYQRKKLRLSLLCHIERKYFLFPFSVTGFRISMVFQNASVIAMSVSLYRNIFSAFKN